MALLNREITIAGGGLAGLALACALRLRKVPVVVLEAGFYPRHRVCGEFISGVSDETLTTLGISPLFTGALFHHSLAWLENGRTIHQDYFKNAALGISRHCLDARLKQRLEMLGGSIQTGVRASPKPRDGLVWTAGRRPRNSQWLGLKAHIIIPPKSADLEMHVGTNGYAGLADVEDGWTNICGLFRVDHRIRATGADLLPTYLEAGGNHDLAATLRSCEWRTGSFTAIAGFEFGRQAPVPGLLALGDAESMIPPFSGNGMSMAFQAAESAIYPLLAWSQGRQSWQETANTVRAAVTRRFRRRLTVAGSIHPLLFKDSGKSLLRALSTTNLLPFQSLLALIR